MDQLGIPGANTIALDRRKGMHDLIGHLLAFGHTTFGLLGITGTTRSLRDRLAGIESALVANGLGFATATRSLDALHTRDNDFEYGRALARSFTKQKHRPTAFVALNDEIAIGALHGLQEEGVRVPKVVSVAGFNNQDVCLMPAPQLTTVDQQIQATIDAAAGMLLTANRPQS